MTVQYLSFIPDYCSVTRYQCNNGACILNNQVCDAIPDCGEDEDEQNCGRIIAPYYICMPMYILPPRPLSNDPRYVQCIYQYSHASKRFVKVYMLCFYGCKNDNFQLKTVICFPILPKT